MKHGAGATRKPNDSFVRKFGIRIAVYLGSRGGGKTGDLKVKKSCSDEVERRGPEVFQVAGRRAACGLRRYAAAVTKAR